MNNASILFIFILLCFNSWAQDTTLFAKSIPFDNIKGLTFTFASETCTDKFVLPKYSLGNDHLGKYLSEHTKYPASSVDGGKEEIKGQFIISFVISKKGGVKDIQILSSPHIEVSNEMIKAIKKLKSFELAKCNGDPIEITIFYSAYFTGMNK
jgi:hypothetical protein